MDETTTLDVVPNVDAEYEAAIDLYLLEMQRMKEEMDQRQNRIEQMRAETEEMLADLNLNRE